MKRQDAASTLETASRQKYKSGGDTNIGMTSPLLSYFPAGKYNCVILGRLQVSSVCRDKHR
jgi:hypothetical protein